jgi:phage terminase large subunit
VQIQTTKIYESNLRAWFNRHNGIRRALNEGGTYSSKTWSILSALYLIAAGAKEPLLISIVSESLPHLKRGCIRDFRAILGDAWDGSAYNKTEQTYTVKLSTIEFFGADESSKIRGPRRDILYLNEANNIPWDTARGLDVRTKIFTFADWNPVSEFWAHEYWVGNPENEYIHSTYQDALNVLPPEVVKNIESNRNDPNWWNIYGLGKLGKIEGLVYPHFEQVNELPQGDYFYGLDFGYSNDPSVLTKNVIIEDRLYSQELIYQTGLTNDMISNRMNELGVRQHYDEIFADAAEPKSIEEIYRSGFNIKACPKGADSVEYGHQKVRQYKQYWTKDSTNCIKEQRNFRYIPDKDGKLTDKTTHNFSHGMDSRRYAVIGKINSHSEVYIG